MPDLTKATDLSIERLDGETLEIDGLGLARAFFRNDPSSVGAGSYDSLAGTGERDRITTSDIQAINRTMRARSKHDWWEPLLDREVSWLTSLDPEFDLLGASEDEWRLAGGEELASAALRQTIGPRRGPSVATKVLHLKRPKFFPVLDDFVAVMLGINMPDDATSERRAEIALRLLMHIRAQGRANLPQLLSVQAALDGEGLSRSLVRILDAVLWFSHPAAGLNSSKRMISVRAAE